jgi:hypothetical protein
MDGIFLDPVIETKNEQSHGRKGMREVYSRVLTCLSLASNPWYSQHIRKGIAICNPS